MTYSRAVLRKLAVHGGLFVACCVTTTLVGYLGASPHSLAAGLAFGGTLMAILTCHELGHYVVARRRGVDVSLPYFIPLPPPTLGTLGAVIRMREQISDRGALFDVGASGPIAGLVVAIPLLVVGLSISPLAPITPGGSQEGNSLLYAALKYAVFHRWLPGGGVDVVLHPMALAAWVGILVTMINLMPIGQLDGGHVARAALGDRHERMSARLHVALPAIGGLTGAVMLAIALHAGRGLIGALDYAKDGVVPWLVWWLLLAFMRRQAGEYHPPVDDIPLDPLRRRLALGMLVVFALIATPVPFRQVL
ncbi:MAG TPA: site-2 protease family protein [Kofleriaceae bacterium]|nr:site-2 protease family protein [Kofleriaceae bacterium]